MSTATLLAFLGAAMLVTLAPGPDNLMVVSLALGRGRRAGLGFGLGCALGCLTHTLWATLGVGALLAASPWALRGLMVAGAVYLAWLGVQAWRHAADPAGSMTLAGGSDALWRHFRQGFVANAVNPKVMLFFLAFLPQFVSPAAAPAWRQMLLLGGLFALQTALLFGALALLAGRAGPPSGRGAGGVAWRQRVVAVVFWGLAARLLSGLGAF